MEDGPALVSWVVFRFFGWYVGDWQGTQRGGRETTMMTCMSTVNARGHVTESENQCMPHRRLLRPVPEQHLTDETGIPLPSHNRRKTPEAPPSAKHPKTKKRRHIPRGVAPTLLPTYPQPYRPFLPQMTWQPIQETVPTPSPAATPTPAFNPNCLHSYPVPGIRGRTPKNPAACLRLQRPTCVGGELRRPHADHVIPN